MKNLRTLSWTVLCAGLLLIGSGCAVTRGQETVGAYLDDSAITTAVKGRFVDNKDVDASAISVETLGGEVILSGFAKSSPKRPAPRSWLNRSRACAPSRTRWKCAVDRLIAPPSSTR